MFHGRFTEGLDRGFDIITNSKFNDKSDPCSKTVYDPHCAKPQSLWTKIQASSTRGFEEVKGINELRTPSDLTDLASDD